jgi:hypothetical protein
MSPRGFDSVLVLGCCVAGLYVGVWSVAVAGLFFAVALVLTANLHLEAVASSSRGGPSGDRRG